MIRAAIVGMGWWGRHMAARLTDGDTIRAVTAVEPNPANSVFATRAGLPVLGRLEDALASPGIDAIILCTPHSLHTQQVLACAAAGKHVFCEKPLALTAEDARRSIEACRNAGVILGIGHERRFEPAMLALKQLVAEGALGTIMHVEANFSHDKLANVPAGDWRTSPKDAPAAGMTAMGIHLTDLFVHLLGPIAEVYASTTSRVAYEQNGDVVSVHAQFVSGATGYLNAILVTPLYLRFTLFGSEGWVEIRNHTHPDTPGPVTMTRAYRTGAIEAREYEWADTVKANVEAFARAITTGEPYLFTDAEKLANIATLEAIARSASTRLPVKVAAG